MAEEKGILDPPGDDSLVLVTGASGYIAGHIIKLLLERGYRVRGTIRSVKRKKRCRTSLQFQERKN